MSFNGNAEVNRETACQMAFNALKAFTVDYN